MSLFEVYHVCYVPYRKQINFGIHIKKNKTIKGELF